MGNNTNLNQSPKYEHNSKDSLSDHLLNYSFNSDFDSFQKYNNDCFYSDNLQFIEEKNNNCVVEDTDKKFINDYNHSKNFGYTPKENISEDKTISNTNKGNQKVKDNNLLDSLNNNENINESKKIIQENQNLDLNPKGKILNSNSSDNLSKNNNPDKLLVKYNGTVEKINTFINNINSDINNTENQDENLEENQDNNEILNRKRKRSKEIKEISNHIGNIFKKTRIMVIDNLYSFINETIRKIYDNKIGKSISIKQFLPLDKKILYNSNVEYDKEFLNKTLKDILSINISEKYRNYPIDKNKQLVQILINDSEKEGEYFKKLFDLTFLDCLNHIRGTEYLDILKGLIQVDDLLNKEVNQDEIDSYKTIIFNYEKIIINKKPRQNTKSEKINN